MSRCFAVTTLVLVSVFVHSLLAITDDGVNNNVITTTDAANATCVALDVCFEDGDCHKGGRCIGAFIGKCNCNACINYWRCEDDTACGGLHGACDTKTNQCKCTEAYKANGYPEYVDALRNLCNVKDCGRDTDTCHGLPCHTGRCICMGI